MLPNLATGGTRAAVKVISSDDLIENGGSFRIQGRVAFRVNNLTGQTSLPASHQAMAVYPVTQADIDSGRFVLAGGGPAVRVVDIDSEGISRAVMGGAAVPVYVVEGEALGVSVPDAPTNLVATQNGASQIDLTWNAVTGADGYYIERSDGDNSSFVQIDSSVSNSYSDTVLPANVYYYRVRAFNSIGVSGYSNEAWDVYRNAYADELATLWGGSIVSYVPLWECVGSPYAEDYAGANDGLYSSTGVTLSEAGIGDGRTSALFDGTTGHVNMYTAGLASAFNGAEGAVFGWFKVSAAEWSDGVVRFVFRLAAPGSNQIQIIKSSVTGRFEYTYTAGGTQKQYRKESTNNTTWCSFALTWSKSNNRVRCYFNGAQVGSTLTGLGTWVGALDSVSANIGAQTSAPANCWKGNLAHIVILDREATAAEIAAAHTLPLTVGTSVCVTTTPTTYTVASGGDIPAAIALMRGGDILELEAGGTYTFGSGTSGINGLPNGFPTRYTRVIGNGATVTGGEYNIYVASKSYLSFENINCEDGRLWNALVTLSNHINFTDCDFYNPSTAASYDCWRADNSSYVNLLRCDAHSTTDFDGTRAHDGFELWGPCTDVTFTDCTAYDIKNGPTEQEGHGFETYGQLAGELCQRVTMINCEAYNCQVGFSCEGGPLSLSHVDVVCDGCSSHDNAFYDYQGIEGSTLYIENHTGGTTNGSVTILS